MSLCCANGRGVNKEATGTVEAAVVSNEGDIVLVLRLVSLRNVNVRTFCLVHICQAVKCSWL